MAPLPFDVRQAATFRTLRDMTIKSRRADPTHDPGRDGPPLGRSGLWPVPRPAGRLAAAPTPSSRRAGPAPGCCGLTSRRRRELTVRPPVVSGELDARTRRRRRVKSTCRRRLCPRPRAPSSSKNSHGQASSWGTTRPSGYNPCRPGNVDRPLAVRSQDGPPDRRRYRTGLLIVFSGSRRGCRNSSWGEAA